MSQQGSSAGKGGNIYNQSSAALSGAGGALGGAAAMYGQPGLSGTASTYDPASIGGAQANIAQMADPNAIASGIPGYMNPYTSNVIDNATADINRMHNIQQDQNGAQASAMGAFGGSRHGLVEAQTSAEAQRNIGNLSGTLYNQGFNTAAGLSAQDIQNQMGVNQWNAGAMNQGNQFNANMDYATQMANQASMNAGGQFNANAQNQRDMAASNDQIARAGGLMGVGGGLGNLGNTMFGIGQATNQGQMQAGGMQQALLQSILGGAGGQYEQFMNRPQNMLDLQLNAIGMNPMRDEKTTTETITPGMLEYLGLGAQALGAWRGTA